MAVFLILVPILVIGVRAACTELPEIVHDRVLSVIDQRSSRHNLHPVRFTIQPTQESNAPPSKDVVYTGAVRRTSLKVFNLTEFVQHALTDVASSARQIAWVGFALTLVVLFGLMVAEQIAEGRAYGTGAAKSGIDG
jgi:hypothetical protein